MPTVNHVLKPLSRQDYFSGLLSLHVQAWVSGRNGGQFSNHDAVMSRFKKLAVQAIATWSSFIAEMQAKPISTQLLDQLPDVVRAVWNCPPAADLAATLPLCDRERYRRLMDIRPLTRSVHSPIMGSKGAGLHPVRRAGYGR